MPLAVPKLSENNAGNFCTNLRISAAPAAPPASKGMRDHEAHRRDKEMCAKDLGTNPTT
jgi:hypothetical protein